MIRKSFGVFIVYSLVGYSLTVAKIQELKKIFGSNYSWVMVSVSNLWGQGLENVWVNVEMHW